jgi:hypothetical protein
MEDVKLKLLGVFATHEEVAAILALRDRPEAVPAAINAAAEVHGLPRTQKGYGINADSREFIGPEEE